MDEEVEEQTPLRRSEGEPDEGPATEEEREEEDEPDDDAPFVPHLNRRERDEARARATINAPVIHEVIREQGRTELARSWSALWWSGTAAGLSMGLSVLAQGLLAEHLPDSDWSALVMRMGYPVGFLAVILGRQQLFTESTVTAVIPVLSRRDLRAFGELLRLWVIVLVANLAGGLAFVTFAGHAGVFPGELKTEFGELAQTAASPGALSHFTRGLLAGWMIALMVWMLPGAGAGRAWIVIAMTYFIGLGELSHVIAGSIEVLYGVVTGEVSTGTYLVGYLGPTLAGNALGGVLLVAALNHAQTVAGTPPQQPPAQRHE